MPNVTVPKVRHARRAAGSAGRGRQGAAHVVSSRELDRIKGSVQSRHRSVVDVSEQKRRRKEISDARVKTWGNTLDALRRKKEEDKVRRLEDYEKEQQKLDAKEAAYRAAQRAETIERAEAMLWEQTDRVKALNERLLLSDVNAERQAQIERKKARDERRAQLDRQFEEEQRQKLMRANQLEVEKAKKRERENKRIAQTQKVQLNELRNRFAYVQQIVKEEGEQMKAQARRNEENDRLELQRLREKAKAMQEEQLECNKYLQKLKDEEKAKEQAEDEYIRNYAKQHEQKLRERKERQLKIAEEKQAVRQKLIDSQVAYLKTLKSNEDQRIQKQVEEKEQRDSEALAIKARKAAQLRQEIIESRAEQMERKRRDEAERIKAENEEAARVKRLFEEAVVKEKAKQQARRDVALGVQEFQRKQVIEKRRNDRESREAWDENARKELRQLESEDAKFKAHAQRRLDEWEAKGRDMAPMHVHLGKVPKITTNSF